MGVYESCSLSRKYETFVVLSTSFEIVQLHSGTVATVARTSCEVATLCAHMTGLLLEAGY